MRGQNRFRLKSGIKFRGGGFPFQFPRIHVSPLFARNFMMLKKTQQGAVFWGEVHSHGRRTGIYTSIAIRFLVSGRMRKILGRPLATGFTAFFERQTTWLHLLLNPNTESAAWPGSNLYEFCDIQLKNKSTFVLFQSESSFGHWSRQWPCHWSRGTYCAQMTSESYISSLWRILCGSDGNRTLVVEVHTPVSSGMTQESGKRQVEKH